MVKLPKRKFLEINSHIVDRPLKDQVVFNYEKALHWKPHLARDDIKCPPQICIKCMCKIFQHFWSPATEYYRRTGLVLSEVEELQVTVIKSNDVPTQG